MISMIIGGLIPMFCTVAPGSGAVLDMATKLGKTFGKLDKAGKISGGVAKFANDHLGAVVGSGIGTAANMAQIKATQEMHKGGMAAGDTPM